MAGCEDCTLLLFMFALSVPGHVSRNLSAVRKTAGTVPVRTLSFAPCTRSIRPDGACRQPPLAVRFRQKSWGLFHAVS